jgi:predicted outer membrane repeat protein
MALDGVSLVMNQVIGPFGQGGAIYVNHNGLCQGWHSALGANTAEFGGAIAALNAQINMTNTNFTNNNATQYDGGAIYMVSLEPAQLNLTNASLIRNR